MTIQTKSVFYYGFTVTENNTFLNYDEGTAAGELTAQLRVGTYSMEEAATEVARALTESSDLLQTYTVTVDRDTRIFSISAASAFECLVTSGSNAGTSYWGDIGFTTDRTSLVSHDSDEAAGSEFKPQFFLQSYVDADNNLQSVSEKINEAASGQNLEIVKFGNRRLYEFNITLQNDIVQTGCGEQFIESDPNGVANLRSLLEFCVQKTRLEFMKDRDDRSTFNTVLLESAPGNRNGTGFKLREMLGSAGAGYFETGNLVFRRLS